MTHLLYSRWCPASVAAKAKLSQHYHQKDRLPVVQLDYTFISTKGTGGESTGQQTILTLIDVRRQLATAIIVPQQCMNHYTVTEANPLSLRSWQGKCHTTDIR